MKTLIFVAIYEKRTHFKVCQFLDNHMQRTCINCKKEKENEVKSDPSCSKRNLCNCLMKLEDFRTSMEFKSVSVVLVRYSNVTK